MRFMAGLSISQRRLSNMDTIKDILAVVNAVIDIALLYYVIRVLKERRW